MVLDERKRNYKPLKMVLNTKESGMKNQEKEKGKDIKYGQTGLCMKDIGKTIKQTVEGG